jgi:hypothetical protein
VIRQLSALVAWGAIISVIGCGKSDPHNRQPVSGTVSINGKIIPYGNIEFVPAENQPTTVTLEVRDGKFGVAQAGGIAPGKYVVRVQGFDGPPPPPGDTPGVGTGPQPKSIVPEKFGAQSKETVTIKAGDKNVIELNLKN